MTILFASLLILAILIIVFISECDNTLIANLEDKIKQKEIIFDIITEKYGPDECDKIRLEYMHRILPPPMEEIK